MFNVSEILAPITTPVIRAASTVAIKTEEHIPEIAIGIGIISGVATVVTACRSTLKADEILDEFAANKAKIEAAEKAAAEMNREYDKGRDLLIAYRDMGIGFAKLYALPIALGAVSIASFLWGYNVLHARNVGLISAYTALEEGYNRYRRRVVDKFGVEADREFSTGVKNKKVLVKDVDKETGEVSVEEKEVPVIDYDNIGDPANYDRIFSGETSSVWKPDPYYNDQTLRGLEQSFNRILHTKRIVYLSDVYEALGFEATPETRLVGWYDDPAYPDQTHISFGLMPSIYEECGDHVYPTGKVTKAFSGWSYYLTFNIDGLIWDINPITNKRILDARIAKRPGQISKRTKQELKAAVV